MLAKQSFLVKSLSIELSIWQMGSIWEIRHYFCYSVLCNKMLNSLYTGTSDAWMYCMSQSNIWNSSSLYVNINVISVCVRVCARTCDSQQVKLEEYGRPKIDGELKVCSIVNRTKQDRYDCTFIICFHMQQ